MMNHASTPQSVPSRHDNPFATCWTRPGALPFRFGDGGNIEKLIAKLAAQNWLGEIIGPHGSGKSTLLAALTPALAAAGARVHSIVLRNRQRHLPGSFLRGIHEAKSAEGISPVGQYPIVAMPAVVVTVDGYDQLSRLARWQLKRRCRGAGAGLIVSSHAPTGLPNLMHLAPNRSLIHQLVRDLCTQMSSRVTPADVDACHAIHGSNVRAILFDLYLQHECWRRAARTSELAGT
jgi:hypothetical protein